VHLYWTSQGGGLVMNQDDDLIRYFEQVKSRMVNDFFILFSR